MPGTALDDNDLSHYSPGNADMAYRLVIDFDEFEKAPGGYMDKLGKARGR